MDLHRPGDENLERLWDASCKECEGLSLAQGLAGSNMERIEIEVLLTWRQGRDWVA